MKLGPRPNFPSGIVLKTTPMIDAASLREAFGRSRCAPFLKEGDRRALIAEAIAKSTKWTALALGNKLGLTIEERTALDIRTLRAAGMTRKVQKRLRKQQDAERKRTARRDAGCMTRDEYESTSISRLKPWEPLGISERTWYRRQQKNTPYIADGLLPSVSHAVVTISIM